MGEFMEEILELLAEERQQIEILCHCYLLVRLVEVNGEASLPIEAHGVLEAILDEELLIALGPLGSDDGRLFADSMPELLCDVRSEGGEEDEEWLEYFARRRLQALLLVDADHEGSYGGIEGELLDVLRHLADQLVQALEFFLGSGRVSDTQTVGRVVQPPQLTEEAVYAVDTIGVPGLALLKRTEEHLIQTERVGTVALDDHVGVDDIVHRLTHLLDGPSADVLAILEDEVSRSVLGAP